MTATTPTEIDVVEERKAAWRRFNAMPVDEKRRTPLSQLPPCVTCGGRATARYPDGSPSFGHHHHQQEA